MNKRLKKLEKLTKQEKNDIYLIHNFYIWDKKTKLWADPIEHLDKMNFNGKPYVVETDKPLLYIWIDENDDYKWYNFFCTKHLLAYRTRPDGLIGVQTAESSIDTRLSTQKKDNKVYDKLDNEKKDKIKKTDSSKAEWGNEDISIRNL